MWFINNSADKWVFIFWISRSQTETLLTRRAADLSKRSRRGRGIAPNHSIDRDSEIADVAAESGRAFSMLDQVCLSKYSNQIFQVHLID